MKKLLFALIVLLFSFGITQAQENGIQLVKSAVKALVSYNMQLVYVEPAAVSDGGNVGDDCSAMNER